MFIPLKEISLKELCKQPIMLDANILMVGINERNSDPNCSFENMKKLYIEPIVQSFQNIIIHEMVYDECDDLCKEYIDSCKNIQIVSEGELYGRDPQYTTTFNNIANHDRVNYKRTESHNRGDVFSLAYAAFYNIKFFCSKDIMVDEVTKEIRELRGINIITFDIVVLIAFIYHNSKNIREYNRALKSIYKKYGEDVIKRHKLPRTLAEYIRACEQYI